MKRSTPITGAASRKKQRIVLPPAIKNVSVQQQEWRGGSQQTVRWASEGDVPTVDISLYKGDFYGKILVHHVPNSGTCIVTVPSGLSPANDYRVQVESTINDSVSARSSRIAINADATPPAIKNVSVQQPIWHGGSQQMAAGADAKDVFNQHVMDKVSELQHLGFVKFGFDRAGTSTAVEKVEEKKLWSKAEGTLAVADVGDAIRSVGLTPSDAELQEMIEVAAAS